MILKTILIWLAISVGACANNNFTPEYTLNSDYKSEDKITTLNFYRKSLDGKTYLAVRNADAVTLNEVVETNEYLYSYLFLAPKKEIDIGHRWVVGDHLFHVVEKTSDNRYVIWCYEPALSESLPLSKYEMTLDGGILSFKVLSIYDSSFKKYKAIEPNMLLFRRLYK